MASSTLKIVSMIMLCNLDLLLATPNPNSTKQVHNWPTGVLYPNKTDLASRLRRNEELLQDYLVNGSKSNGCNADWTHKMPSCYQICNEWCWATSVTMTSDYYKGESYCAGFECAVAGHEFKHNCCPWSNSCHNKQDDQGSACNKGGQDSQMVDAINYYTGGTFTHTGAMSQTDLDNALNSKRVIMYTVSWQQGGGHALVLGGCGNGFYYLHDPWGWYSAMGYPQPPPWQGLTYQQLLEYRPTPDGANPGKWVGSIFWSYGDDQRHTEALKQAESQRALHGKASEARSVLV